MKKRIFFALVTVFMMMALSAVYADNEYKAYNGNIYVSGNSASDTVKIMLVAKTAPAVPTQSDIKFFTEDQTDKDGNYSITFPYDGSINLADYEVRESTGAETAVSALASPEVGDLIDIDINMVKNNTYAGLAAELSNYYNVDVSNLNLKVFAAFYDNAQGQTLLGMEKYNLGNTDMNAKITIPENAVSMKCFVWKQENETFVPVKEQTVKNITSSDSVVINCWGDSLTAGAQGGGTTYPNVLSSLIGSNVTVNNYGVGGEDTRTIAGRTGAVPFVLGEDITIPATTTPVNLSFLEGDPLHQGDAGINPCYIGGIEGSLSRTDTGLQFTRTTAGSEKAVTKGSTVTRAALGGINIIFSGTNDKYAMGIDVDYAIKNIVNYQKQIVNKVITDGGKYLVVGAASGVSGGEWLDEFEYLEKEQSATFGKNYLNLRKLLTDSAIYDEVGINLTAADLTNMSNGAVPATIISDDDVHFNADGYRVLARAIYNKLASLGWVVSNN